MDASDVAEQRANAVAKLRRAASLPRMKDGRRPPMRRGADGGSEAEAGQGEENKDGEDDSGEAVALTPEEEEKVAAEAGIEYRETSGSPEETRLSVTPEATMKSAVGSEGSAGESKGNEPSAKRRSRSRSRSRNSKDLRLKMKAAASATTSDVDESTVSEQNLPTSSVIPNPYFMPFQMGGGHPLLSPLSPFGFSATPISNAPPAAMPSLEALQSRHLQGLFRSNSAAARMGAMKKLIGEVGPDSGQGHAAISSSPFFTQGRSQLTRGNTVAGEERVAARQKLLRRLNERIEKTDTELTSGDDTAPSASVTTTKARRRRSRRKSANSALVDDRDNAAAGITPAVSPSPAPEDLFTSMGLGVNPLANILLPQIPRMYTPSREQDRVSTPDRSNETPDLLTFTPQLRAFTPDLRSHTPSRQTPEPLKLTDSEPRHYSFDPPLTHRGVVVEEEDEMPMHKTPPRSTRTAAANLPLPPSADQTPTQTQSIFLPPSAPFARHHHNSDSPSMLSTLSEAGVINGLHVPVIMPDPERHSPFRQDVFPKSPFGTPIRENMRRDDEEERVLYPDSRFDDREVSWIADSVAEGVKQAYAGEDREISWVADPVPEAPRPALAERDAPSWIEPDTRMPVYDEDEEDDEEVIVDVIESSRPHGSPRDSADTQDVIVEGEISPNATTSYRTNSDLNQLSPQASQDSSTSTATMNTNIRESNFSSVSGTSINHEDAPSRLDRTHSRADSLHNWEEQQQGGSFSGAPGLSSKRSADSTSTSAWNKMKSTFTRSGSSLGRRSRSNSIVKRENTESSRESGASLLSGKRESKGEGPSSAVSGSFAWQQQPPVVQVTTSSTSPAGSVSMLALSAPPPRSGVSPIPPPSDSDVAKYMDPKLFPFPGMVKLQEERSRGMSVSSPDILSQSTSGEKQPTSVNSSASSQLHDVRERTLSHQASDSRLLTKFQMSQAQPMKMSTSTSSQIDYFNIPSPPQVQASSSSGLPFTREGVKKWLNARMGFSKSSSTNTAHEHRAPDSVKKPSLSDLLGTRKDVEISDWEEDKPWENSRAPTMTSVNTVKAMQVLKDDIQESSPDDPVMAYKFAQPLPRSPRTIGNLEPEGDLDGNRESRHTSVPLSSRDPASTTPDPLSSADDSGSPDLSSQASHSSMASLFQNHDPNRDSSKVALLLERLDQVLRADELNRMWSSALNSPPRRLMLSSPMLQVANCDTVKDRFLFLFSDILIIGKPMLPDHDSLLDSTRPYPPDRKFMIKNVVHLKDVRLNIDRDEDPGSSVGALISQRPDFIRRFVEEFSVDADTAIARIIDQHNPKGHIAIGRLLVQLPELNRSKLGEYLSRRSCRPMLKAYLDAFGFEGIDIDAGLRIFLLSIHIPSGSGHANTLESLLDTFAGRWYEANTGIVAFARELAMRLVRAIVRLNEALHSAVGQENGNTGYSRHHISSRDFTEAFRRHDPRGDVPDSMLEKIYMSVRNEKLCQARNPANGRAPHPVVLKRAVPPHVTYRRQSEPIVIRIPQPDPQLTIQLHGQDLVFDPPTLNFAKSAEASFRITGTSLGQKRIVLACSGSNAPNYSGLPLSTTVSVERAFMRNTFQIAFLNHVGQKRKYMFSVDDPVIRHEWRGSLKRQIEAAKSAQSPDLPGVVPLQVYQAAETVSFRALQDTLLTPEAAFVNDTLPQSTQNGGPENGVNRRQHDSIQTLDSQRKDLYKRSQSRSQIYRLGEGRDEQDLLNGADEEHGDDHHLSFADDLHGQNVRLWTSSDLELLCQQNSAISLVLSLLQAAQPFDVDEELNNSFQFPGVAQQSQQIPYQL